MSSALLFIVEWLRKLLILNVSLKYEWIHREFVFFDLSSGWK